MEVLLTAFNGEKNSSKLLLDKISVGEKLYLKNSFDKSVKQLVTALENHKYDTVITFGQAPLGEGTIKIETVGQGNERPKKEPVY